MHVCCLAEQRTCAARHSEHRAVASIAGLADQASLAGLAGLAGLAVLAGLAGLVGLAGLARQAGPELGTYQPQLVFYILFGCVLSRLCPSRLCHSIEIVI